MNKGFCILLMVTGSVLFLYFGYTALVIGTSDSLFSMVYKGQPLLAVCILCMIGLFLFIAGFLFIRKSTGKKKALPGKNDSV